MMKKVRKQKREKGITLVALVVTIIVLIILAGISIALISGSNGLLNKAEKIVNEYEIARFIEAKELSDTTVYADMLTNQSGYKSLYDYIKDTAEKNHAETGEKSLKGDKGTYWIDDENQLHFRSDVTGHDASVIKGSKGELVIKEITMPDGSIHPLLKADTPYKVLHQQMNVDGNGYTVVAEETLYGIIGDTVSPNVNTYTGFTSPEKQTLTIKAEGENVITYQYARNKYTISFDTNGGTACAAITDYYGATVTMPQPTRSGYLFTVWNTNYTTIPAQNVTVTASWKQDIPPATSTIVGSTYGNAVNYSAKGVVDWEIFYNDGNYIYLISKNRLRGDTLNRASGITLANGGRDVSAR